MKPVHTLEHTIHGCGCEAKDITRCAAPGCGRELPPVGVRLHVDVCGRRCFTTILRVQREAGNAA